MINMDWLLDPGVQTASLGACAVGLLALTVSAQASARAAKKALGEYRVTTDVAIRDLNESVETLKSAPVEYAEQMPAPLHALGSVQGMNLTARTRALRMHSRGEQASSIAASLGARQEEVELLLKLNRILEPPVARAATYAG